MNDDVEEKECILLVEDSDYLNNCMASKLRENNDDVSQ